MHFEEFGVKMFNVRKIRRIKLLLFTFGNKFHQNPDPHSSKMPDPYTHIVNANPNH
jgi:hypothetical protein